MAYSKKITVKKGTVEAVSIFIVAALVKYVPGLEGYAEAALLAAVSGVLVSAINYIKHK